MSRPRALLDGRDVTVDFLECMTVGDLPAGGRAFRCPGLIGADLGTGFHTFEVTVDVNGRPLRDAVTWEILETLEPPTADTIFLSADPSTIFDLDPDTGEGESALQALVLDAGGRPLPGVGVVFGTDHGQLDSGGQARQTDADGIARDRLVTSESARVTASSGDASSEVTVTVSAPILVGNVSLVATSSPSGPAPLKVSFQASVLSTLGFPIENVIVSVIIAVGDGFVDVSPNGTGSILVTDRFGIVRFDVVNITMDGTEVFAASGGVSSQVIHVTITSP
jgi:hypothetical protein